MQVNKETQCLFTHKCRLISVGLTTVKYGCDVVRSLRLIACWKLNSGFCEWLPRFQNLLLIVYNHIRIICAIIQRLFGQKRRQLLPLTGYAPDWKGFWPVTKAVLLKPEGSVAEQWRKKTEGNPNNPSSPGKQLLKLIWWWWLLYHQVAKYG